MAANPFRLDPYEKAEDRTHPAARRYSRPVSIEDVLSPWLKQNKLAEGGVLRSVYSAWNEVVGELMARRARPTRFLRGELVVEVSSMVHLHELKNFTGEGFRLAVNRKLGSDRVERVVFQLAS